MPAQPCPLPVTIDCAYRRESAAAAYLMLHGGRAAFVDTNTARAVPLLLDALRREGHDPESVDWILLTHIHLDHAGGASVLANACPNARIIVHPRGARHLADPDRLIASAKAVYGEALYEELFAPIRPIPAERIHAAEDGETVRLAGRELVLLHTPGHAHHHLCVSDPATGSLFTGDMCGVSYPFQRRGATPYFLFTTAPTDFDPELARRSLDRIEALAPARLCLSHFGVADPAGPALDSLRRSLDDMERVLDAARASGLDGDALEALCLKGVREAAESRLTACGLAPNECERGQMEGDLLINARGLAWVARKER
jgi:glyoxylase-like metal-dependent hydrolase (beta-lactamase superfamily II)